MKPSPIVKCGMMYGAGTRKIRFVTTSRMPAFPASNDTRLPPFGGTNSVRNRGVLSGRELYAAEIANPMRETPDRPLSQLSQATDTPVPGFQSRKFPCALMGL